MKRLRYVSRFNQNLSQQDVDALVRNAQETNAQVGLTGILMSSGKLFFQVLEGPDDSVNGIFARIAEDPRHTDVLVLHTENNVAERLFPDWSMRKIDLNDASDARLAPSRQLLERIADMQLELDGLTYQLECTIWEELTRVD